MREMDTNSMYTDSVIRSITEDLQTNGKWDYARVTTAYPLLEGKCLKAVLDVIEAHKVKGNRIKWEQDTRKYCSGNLIGKVGRFKVFEIVYGMTNKFKLKVNLPGINPEFIVDDVEAGKKQAEFALKYWMKQTGMEFK